MRFRRTAAVLGAGVLMIGLAAAPAQAHDTGDSLVRDGIGRAGGTVRLNHRVVTSCDKWADGFGTRTWYWTSNGNLDYVGDNNGNGGGCGEEVVFDGGYAVSFQVCYKPISIEVCNPWKNA